MVFLKSRYIPNLQESCICECFFPPAAFRFSQAEIVSEFQNIPGFINATKSTNCNTAAINITFCYCGAAKGAAHQLSVFLLPLSQQAADVFCSKTCKCTFPSSLIFCAIPLAEGTLNALHYVRCTWKMDSEMATTSCEQQLGLMNSLIPDVFPPVTYIKRKDGIKIKCLGIFSTTETSKPAVLCIII